ncbi:glycosyltransferase family 2 protein [bacterium]|nr:MAG: glycosyltransferase family 2 protein [bacterium]
MDLAVVVVSFNTKEKLRSCLRSVYASRTKYSYEVWVVDNASADGSREMVRGEFMAVNLIKNEQNLGFAKANNQAIRESRGEPGAGKEPRYILLLNSDVDVAPDTFDKMILFMDNNPAAGISGCRVMKSDGTLDKACRRSFPDPQAAIFKFSGLAALFPKSRILAKYNLTFLPETATAEVDAVMGAFLLIRQNVVDKIGLLDEDYFMYGEDLDWCFRAKAAGYKVLYAPVASVVHYKGSSSRKAPAKMIFEFHRAMQIFYDKHYRAKYGFFVRWLVLFGIWARYFIKIAQNFFRKEKFVSR